jgi:PhnB protein
MKGANPYLNFPGNTMEVFDFYRSVLGGEFLGVMRYRDFGDNGMGVPEGELDKIAHIALPLGGENMLMATDTLESQPLTAGNNFYIHLETDDVQEAERVFQGLSNGGSVEMPLETTEWAEKYGSLRDRFGVQWMISFTGNVEFTMGDPS